MKKDHSNPGMVFFYAILQRAFIFLESAAAAETRLKNETIKFCHTAPAKVPFSFN
ncbi:hypothetical protein CHCC20488_0275 [Bacillus paralicheniformis]|nr:hypothetical protein CHCC20488_0275 [Bacillus paralicheniformis]